MLDALKKTPHPWLAKLGFGKRHNRAIDLLDLAVEEQYAFEVAHPIPFDADVREAAVALRWYRRLHEARLSIPKDEDALVRDAIRIRIETTAEEPKP